MTDSRQIIDDAGCVATHWPGAVFRYLGRTFADDALADAVCSDAWPWVRDRAAGRVARRETCAFADDLSLRYRYSDTTKTPSPPPDTARRLALMVGDLTSTGYNFCLANLYADHTATLGWHADDERDLLPESPIVSVSLGASRLLGLRRVADGWQTSVELRHGDVLVMSGQTQKRWQHCVCKGVAGDGPRVSLTFRRVRS